MLKRNILILLVLALTIGTILITGCGTTPEEEFQAEEDSFIETGPEQDEERYLDPETEDDPYDRDF